MQYRYHLEIAEVFFYFSPGGTAQPHKRSAYDEIFPWRSLFVGNVEFSTFQFVTVDSSSHY